jgi:hypothetical protein
MIQFPVVDVQMLSSGSDAQKRDAIAILGSACRETSSLTSADELLLRDLKRWESRARRGGYWISPLRSAYPVRSALELNAIFSRIRLR